MIGQSLAGDRKHTDDQVITIVSGLPRSGTSLMMRMLEAGGLPVLTDHIRTEDGDNPQGYFEFERVKQMDKGDTSWMPECRGKAVKVISALLKHLPPGEHYRVIFMQRAMEEILASQRKMLEHRGEPYDAGADPQLAEYFRASVAENSAWLARQPNFETLTVDYNELLADPELPVARINAFLGQRLDEAAMRQVIDPALYRNRRQ